MPLRSLSTWHNCVSLRKNSYPPVSSDSIYIWGVSINGGTPKWLVYNEQNPIKINDLGVPPFQETSMCMYIYIYQGWSMAMFDYQRTNKHRMAVRRTKICHLNVMLSYYSIIWVGHSKEKFLFSLSVANGYIYIYIHIFHTYIYIYIYIQT